MEPYILTQDDIARLSEQGFDMRGVPVGAEATAREAEVLRGPVSTAEIPTPQNMPYDPSSDPSAVMPVNSTTSAPVTFTEADGTTSTAPSASAIPQSLPAAAAPGTIMAPTGSNTPLPDQPRGLSGILSGLTGMFGGQGNTAGSFNPAAGGGIAQSTDPFEGLSRNQRMMLGFAALRDAAASLEGRDTSFFNNQLGVFEDARERERLRVQGVMQNRAQAIASLLPVFQEMQTFTEQGLPVPDYLKQIVAQTYAAFGMDGQGGMPVTATGAGGGVAPTQTGAVGGAGAAGGAGGTTPTQTEPTTPMSRAEQLRAENAADQDLLRNASSPEARAAIEARIASRDAEIAQIEAQASAATEAAGLTIPQIDTALNYLVEGFDENGDPVFRPELMTRLGRAGLEALESPEYMEYVGALQTLKSNILIEGLQQATFGALSAAEQQAVEALQGGIDPSNPLGSYRTLVRLRQLAQELIDKYSGSQGGGDQAPASAGTGRINWGG